MISDEQISASLRHAARIVRRNGLKQGTLYDAQQARAENTPPERCRVCAIGAVSVAVTGGPLLDGSDHLDAVLAHLREYMAAHYKGLSVPTWNDRKGRTAWQVALLLRRAAGWQPAPVETSGTAA